MKHDGVYITALLRYMHTNYSGQLDLYVHIFFD